MSRPRFRNYSLLLHASERAQAILAGTGWPARLARGLGWQHGAELDEQRVEAAGRDPARPPLRIGFASDFHAGPMTHPEHIAEAAATLAAASPDLLLVGGDLVSFRHEYVDLLIPELLKIPAPLGRYAVLGNHDCWAGRAGVARELEAWGIEVLVNRNVRLPAPHDDVWICGIDDDLSGDPDPARAMSGANGIRVVLMHAPSTLMDMNGESFALALAGHVHGGQVALPYGIPLYVPKGRLSRLYPGGRYEPAPGHTLIVSRGVGYSMLPVRAFAAPQVHLITLAAPPGADSRR